MNIKTDKVSILIPIFNEAENIPFLFAELKQYFAIPLPFEVEIIFIDDGSKDGSFEVIKMQGNQGFPYRSIKLSRNYGSHAALRAGIQEAEGNYITFLMADLQDPATLPASLYDIMKKGDYEIVWAERNETKNSFLERFFSKGYAMLMQKYVFRQFPDNGFDILLFSQKVKEQLNKNIEPNSSLFLQVLSLGFKQTNFRYNKNKRERGKSKWTLAKKVKMLVDSFVAFSFAPIRFVTTIGLLFFTFGMLWTLYIIIRELTLHDLAAGWPMLTSILMLGFGITNISLGIIAEYLWRTLDASRHRPVFIIDEIYSPLINE